MRGGYYGDSFEDRSIRKFKISKNYTNKVKLSWTRDKDAKGYEIYQYKSKKWVKVATVKGTSKVIKKLQAGTSYKFCIRGYKETEEETIYTEFKNLKVITCPKKLKITDVVAKTTEFTLKWQKEKASGYEIQYCTSKKFRKNVKSINVKKSKKNVTIKKLERGKTYYVRIRAYSKVNGTKYYGSWSKAKR